ncbi:MAG: hypothetical protein HYY40_00850 [Bacteroidetes bacterium]|nr:hypothetical protein [Bacteroidota bacterium]
MKIHLHLIPLLLLFAGNNALSQHREDSIHSSAPITRYPAIHNPGTAEMFKRKGNFFFYWGYNRAAYTKSDIHFWGDGYDFTITDVTAKDEPTTTVLTYIEPDAFTVPQYNYRLGYFFSDKNFISLGEDHMKYGIEKQATRLTGTITTGENTGTYDNTEVLVGEEGEGELSIIDSLPKGFVSEFEHCDGLNDAGFEFGRVQQLWISWNRKHVLTVIGTIGPGLVIPDTEAEVLGHNAYHDQDKMTYHLAGYSFSTSIGIQFDFCNHFFLLTRLKGGYMNLPDINTTIEGGTASQHFSFIEPMLVAGYSRSF